MYQMGFFEVDEVYARIDAHNPLKKIQDHVNWSGLEKIMEQVVFSANNNGGKGGRKPLCGLMMAKIFILQSLYNLSDDAVEFMIEDRLSFKRFLKIPVSKKAPDAKTIWVWRERVKALGLESVIFEWFLGEVANAGYVAKEGQIVDATFVPTHKPTNKHKKQLEKGEPLTKHQEQQKDKDATFTKKSGISYHGYKNHTVVDVKHKIIQNFDVTTASIHDSGVFEGILSAKKLDKAENGVWADSAYRSTQAEKMLLGKGLISHIHERAYRNTPLTAQQKADNKEKSRVRARVEHVYGHMETSMGGMMIHTLTLGQSQSKNRLQKPCLQHLSLCFLGVKITKSACMRLKI